MPPLLTIGLALSILLGAPSAALALGGDYSKEELKEFGELVKGQTPIHGYWVNWEDTFFYAGDTPELNRFLAAYGKLSGLQRRVVIHPGVRKARSPWGRADQDSPCDWSFYRWHIGANGDPRNPAPARVDVWLGSRIRLDELQVPAGMQVDSGGEIEGFIERNRKRQSKPVTQAEAIGQSGIVSVQFDVASAGWSLGPRIPGQPRGPVQLVSGERLKNGGQFYVMLWGDAAGPNEDERTKQLKGKRVRAVGRIQVADPQSARTDYYMTIYDTADIALVK